MKLICQWQLMLSRKSLENPLESSVCLGCFEGYLEMNLSIVAETGAERGREKGG